MKRAALIILIIALALGGCAVETEAPAEPVETPAATPAATEPPKTYDYTVGLLLDAKNGYNDALVNELTALCEPYSYGLLVEYAEGDSEKQQEQAVNMMLKYATVLAIEPADVDGTAELAKTAYDCGGRLINITTPYSGRADVLISADYTKLGAQAGQYINGILPEEVESSVLALMGGVEDFVMQMVYDGLTGEIEDISARFCDCDAAVAHDETAAALSEGSYAAIFAQSPEMGAAAARAAAEAGADIPVVTLGCTPEVAAEIEGGGITAALYTAPKRLAERVLHYYKMFIIDGEYTSAAFDELGIFTATGENIYRAFSTGAPYAGPFA